MNRLANDLRRWWLVLALVGGVLGGCATPPRIDWSSRIGQYTYELAVIELGPPDKVATLKDGTVVAEWLTRHGYSYVRSPFAYSPWWYGPYSWPSVETYTSPNYYLRLIFGPDGKLGDWRQFYK